MATQPYPIKLFRAGISDEDDKGVSGSFKYGHGLEIHGRGDVLACASTTVTIKEGSDVVNDLIQFFVTARDGSTYGFGNAGSVYSISGDPGDPDVNFVYNDENGKIRGAAEWQHRDGTTFVYWATNTSIARMVMNGSVDIPWAAGVVTQDYKTTLDPADYHTMEVASGALMIANNKYLASIDFQGEFDPASVNIRPGNKIKALEERDDYVLMGSYREDNAEEGHIWSWVITALNFVQKKKIPVKGVNAMIYAEFPLIQGGSDGELFTSDFSDALPLNSMGGQVNPDGVTIYNDIARFGTYGGDEPGIWSYGRKRNGRVQALNYDYRLSPTVGGSTVTEIGSIETVNGTILATWATTDGSTVEYGVDELSSTTKASAVYEGLEFDNNEPSKYYLVEYFKNSLFVVYDDTKTFLNFSKGFRPEQFPLVFRTGIADDGDEEIVCLARFYDYLIICSGSRYNEPFKEGEVFLTDRADHLIKSNKDI